jgi:hypothetical protein
MADLSHTFPNGRTVTLCDKTVTLHPEYPACVRICGTLGAAKGEFIRLCKSVSLEEGNDKDHHWISMGRVSFICVYRGENQCYANHYRGDIRLDSTGTHMVTVPRQVAIALLGGVTDERT